MDKESFTDVVSRKCVIKLRTSNKSQEFRISHFEIPQIWADLNSFFLDFFSQRLTSITTLNVLTGVGIVYEFISIID